MTSAAASPQIKRIAIIAPRAASLLPRYGALIQNLLDKRHRLLCLAPDFTTSQLKRLAGLGIECEETPFEESGAGDNNDTAYLKALSQILKEWRPHIVLSYGARPAIYGALAASNARCNHIVSILPGLNGVVPLADLDDQDNEANTDVDHPAAATSLELSRKRIKASARAMRVIDALILHNKEDFNHLQQLGVLSKDTASHVLHSTGVDLAHFTEQPLPPFSMGTAGSPGNSMVFLMVSRLHHSKGVAEYCQAAQFLKAKSPCVQFHLIGQEDFTPGGLSASHIAAYGGSVHYHCPAADIRPLLAAAHVIVQPSHLGEGLPKPLLEALAVGRPVITSNSAGCRATVDERVNGCLVAPGDAPALAQAMHSYLRRPDLIPSMARASRLKAERWFDTATINKQMLEIMQIA